MTSRGLSWIHRGLVLLAVLVVAVWPGLAAPPAPPLSLRVDLDGCEIVRAPPGYRPAAVACELAPPAPGPDPLSTRRLRLWVETSAPASLKVALDKNPPLYLKRLPSLPGDPPDVAPFEIEVFAGASALEVTAEAGGARAEVHVPLFTDEPSAELERAIAVRKDKHAPQAERLAEAERILRPLAGASDPILRAKAAQQLAFVAWIRDKDEGISGLYASMAMERDAGLLSKEVNDGLLLSLTLLEDRHDLDGASQVLDRIEPLLADVPSGRAMAPYYRAIVALERGDLASALELLDVSALEARRLSLAAHLSDVYQEKLRLLALLGRQRGPDVEDLLSWLEKAPRLDPATNPCGQAQRLVNLAWFALLTHTADERTGEQLRKAAAIYSDERRCDRAEERRNTRTDLARWALDMGRLEDAERYLTEVPGDGVETRPVKVVDRELALGRLASLRGDATAALGHFEEAAQRSRAFGLRREEIAARFGAAAALEDLSDVDGALGSYAKAEDLLDRWSAIVPFGAGKQSLFDWHEDGVRRYVGLLARQAQPPSSGKEDEDKAERRKALAVHAACVARRARATLRIFAEWKHRLATAPLDRRAALDRALRRYFEGATNEGAAKALDEAAAGIAGALSPSVCEAPGADEVLLVYHPIPTGWAGFAVTSQETVAKTLDIGEAEIERWRQGVTGEAGEAASAKLLKPFEAQLEAQGVRRIRLLPAGALGGVELHRLPWGKGSLDSGFSVTYGVDVPRATTRPAAGRRALVVAYVSNEGKVRDEYNTALEAKTVVAALEHAGWHPELLEGPDATLENVLRVLQEDDVELFHYAGHSIRQGADAWGSYLTLAHGGRLTIEDVLALRHVPRKVILSSCATDAAGDGAFVADMGIAPAFIVAGADFTVTTVRGPLASFLKLFMQELYGKHLNRLLEDPAAAVDETAESLRRSRKLGGAEPPPLRVLVR